MYITYFLTIPVLNIKQSITIKNDNLVKNCTYLDIVKNKL